MCSVNISNLIYLSFLVVLAVKADELEALQAQCYALAQADQYAPLLELLNATTLLPKDQAIFQKAYCLYRLQRYQEALKLIASATNPSVHLKHLEAQTVRLSHFLIIYQIYDLPISGH